MITIDTTTLSVVLGGVISIGSTMFVWGLLHFNQRRVERDRTRRAILHEVDHIANNIEQLIDLDSGAISDDDLDWVTVTLSTDLLNENFLQINKLTSPEIQSVYEFYEATRVLASRLENDAGGERSKRSEIRQAANEVLTAHKEVRSTMKRSRLSRFTEWYKQLDRKYRKS
jgi:hypothetical protein